MTATKSVPPKQPQMKTGRRENPAIDGPRDNTVCFMLSDGEKLALDRLAFCEQITRSGILAKIAADFVVAADGSKSGREAEKRLLAYLAQCRQSFKKRGKQAAEMVVPPKTEEMK